MSAYYLGSTIETPGRRRAPAAALAGVWFAALVAAIGFDAGRGVLELRGYVPLIVVFTAAVLGFWLGARQGRDRPAVAILAAGTLVAYGFFAWTSTTEFAGRRQLQAVAVQIDRVYRPGDRVINVGSEPLARSDMKSTGAEDVRAKASPSESTPIAVPHRSNRGSIVPTPHPASIAFPGNESVSGPVH